MTVPADWTRSYNEQGFLTIPTPTTAPTALAAPQMADGDASTQAMSAKTTSGGAGGPSLAQVWIQGALLLGLSLFVVVR